jgi:hypothetical protein
VREAACRDAVALMGSGCSARFVREGLDKLVWHYSEALGPGPSYKKRCLIRSEGVIRSPEAPSMFEHVVPRRVTVGVLMSLPDGEMRLPMVRAMMALLAVGCQVTREEDALLAAAGLSRSMPEGWSPWTGNPWVRYAVVGIAATIQDPEDLPGDHETMMRLAGVLRAGGTADAVRW